MTTHRTLSNIALQRLLPAIALLLNLTGCFTMVAADDSQTHEFSVAGNPKVIVQSYNGAVDVTVGTEGRVVALVQKTAQGLSGEEATRNLDDVLVSFEQEGDVVKIIARPRTERPNNGAAVSLAVPAGSALDLETSNGAVTSSGTTAGITVTTSNGDVELFGGRGAIRAVTSNGPMTLAPLDESTVTATSSNGDISYRGSLAGESRFETSNGSIDVSLPSEAAFQVDAVTSNGKVSCEFPVSASEATRTELHGNIGDSGATQITARTSNGSINLRKLP